MKCTKCSLWIHIKCAELPAGHEIWNCGKCGGKAVTASFNRRSSIPRRSLTGLNVSIAGNDTNNNNNTQMMREILELRKVNEMIWERLAAIDNKLRAVVVHHQDEINRLNVTNQQLTEQIRLSLNLNSLQEKSTLPADKNATRQEMAESVDYASVSNSDLGLGPDNRSSSASQDERASHDGKCDQTRATDFYGHASSVVIDRNRTQRNQLHQTRSQAVFAIDPSDVRLASVEPKKCIFVSRLKPNTSISDVIRHVMQRIKVDKDHVSCLKITPKTILNPYFAAFKLDVPENVFEIVLSPEFWPANVVAREFTAIKRATRQNFRPQLTHN